jgi:hypothetical protein
MFDSTSVFDGRSDEFPFDPPSRRGNRLAWFLVGVLSLVVFELTADPALAVVVGCLKFGWDELATARWLRRTDPDRIRGRVTARFYAAWSLWRITGIAIVLMLVAAFALGPILEMRRARGAIVPDVPPEFVTAALVAFFGLAATCLTSALAVSSARWNRIKVWVGPEAKLARRSGIWPPGSVAGKTGETNLANRLMLALVITVAVPLILVLLLLSSRVPLGPPQPGPVGAAPPLAFGVFLVLTLVAVPTLLILAVGRLGPHIVASSPEDCWLLRDASRVHTEDRPSWGLPGLSSG